MSSKPQLEPKANVKEMQITEKHRRISQKVRSGVDKGAGRVRVGFRSKGAPESALLASTISGTDFLNARFKTIIPPFEVQQRMELLDRNDIDIPGSIIFLHSCAENYLKLLGKTHKIEVSGNPIDDLLNIYQTLSEALPDGHYMNIDRWQNSELLRFIVYCGYPDFPDQFFFLPVKNYKLMSKPVADIFIEFTKYLSDSQGFLYPGISADQDFIIECHIPEELDMWDEERPEDEESRQEYLAYLEGEIPEIFKRISSIDTDAEQLLAKCNQIKDNLKGNELELISHIIEGIPLLETDNIASYDYPHLCDSMELSEYYDRQVDFERLFGLVWDDEDWFCDMLMDFINTDLNEFDVAGPYSFLVLSHDTKEPLKRSDYPQKFKDWFVKLFELIENYESTD